MNLVIFFIVNVTKSEGNCNEKFEETFIFLWFLPPFSNGFTILYAIELCLSLKYSSTKRVAC